MFVIFEIDEIDYPNCFEAPGCSVAAFSCPGGDQGRSNVRASLLASLLASRLASRLARSTGESDPTLGGGGPEPWTLIHIYMWSMVHGPWPIVFFIQACPAILPMKFANAR